MEDERLKAVQQEQAQALDNTTNTYNEMINQSDTFYNDLINTSKEYAAQQQDIQNQQYELAAQEIEQNKKYAQQDYDRQQRGAYLDYQAEQKNQADRLRAMGLQNTGYSESTISSMYSTYQNRVATAKQSFDRSVDAYNQQAAQARLANSSALMDIAYKALQQQAEYALQGFQYKNNLTLDLMKTQQSVRNEYWNKYQDIQKQINTEKSLAEEIRQFNANYALNKAKTNADVAYTKAQTEYLNQQIRDNKKKTESSFGSALTEKEIKANGSNYEKATAGGQTFKAKDVDGLKEIVGDNNLDNDVMRYYDSNGQIHFVVKNKNNDGKMEDVTTIVKNYISGKKQDTRAVQNQELNKLGSGNNAGYEKLDINKTKTVSAKNQNDSSYSSYLTNGGNYKKSTANTKKNGVNVKTTTYTFDNGTKIEVYWSAADNAWKVTRLN